MGLSPSYSTVTWLLPSGRRWGTMSSRRTLVNRRLSLWAKACLLYTSLRLKSVDLLNDPVQLFNLFVIAAAQQLSKPIHIW